MNDSQFDDFVNNRLHEYAAPVPSGLWEKVAEGQFDQFVGSTLKDASAPVPDGLWEKISDNLFDNFVADKIDDHVAPVSAGLWGRIADGQFDSFVSGQLRDAEAPVPAGLWEKIKPVEEDDRKGFYWLRYPAAAVLMLALLTAGAFGYFYYTNKDKSNDAAQVITSGASSGNAAKDQQEKSREKNSVAPGADTPSNNETNQTPSVTSPAIHPSENNNSRQTDHAQQRANEYLIPDHTNISSAEQKNNNRLAPAPANPNPIANNSYDVFKNTTGITVKEGVSKTGSDEFSFTPDPYQNNFSAASTISLKRAGSSLLDKQLSTINYSNRYKSIIICPADKGRNMDWFLETYLSPDIAFKSVKNISASPAYMAKKDSSESMQIGYSAGIRLVKPITDNILVKAGIQYTQANEKYTYRTENEVKTTTVVTVRTIIRAPGDTVIVNDTSVVQTAGFRNNTVRNRYRSFDIPITVGYQFGDDDLKFGINAGVAINVSSWYQGIILDSALANVALNKSGNGVYKSNIGLGLIGSISIVKRLSDDLHIFAEPYFRYNLSDMTTPQASFKQRLSLGGLSLGLRFNLNRR